MRELKGGAARQKFPIAEDSTTKHTKMNEGEKVPRLKSGHTVVWLGVRTKCSERPIDATVIRCMI